MNLERFCYRGDALSHRNQEKPFRLDGWMYATNGQICVRVRSEGKDAEDVPPKQRARTIAAFQDFSAETCIELWPGRTSELRDTKCPICHEAIGLALAPQKIAGRLISGYYWWMVSDLGVIRYSPAGDSGDALQFVCGELQGIVMPLVRKEKG